MEILAQTANQGVGWGLVVKDQDQDQDQDQMETHKTCGDRLGSRDKREQGMAMGLGLRGCTIHQQLSGRKMQDVAVLG